MIPRHVLVAHAKGYRTVHKGMLAWVPLPPAGSVPVFRLVMVAVETAPCLHFWVMQPSKDHNITDCRGWPTDAYAYRGLCGHNALYDPVAGDFQLSPDQLQALAAEKVTNHLWQTPFLAGFA